MSKASGFKAHTGSYKPIWVILLMLTASLFLNSFHASLARVEASPPPQSGSLNVNAVVALKEPAVILVPSDGQRFSQSTITVSGTCGEATYVEIYKNNIFAGTTTCNGGNFSLTIDLLLGQNVLIAKVLDGQGDYGPDSAPVTVYNDQTPPQPPPSGGGSGGNSSASSPSQFILTTQGLYLGGQTGVLLKVQVNIIGGAAPYTIVVDWQDGQRDYFNRPASGVFNATHIYNLAGTYQIKINGTDNIKQKAYVQTTAVVFGKALQAKVLNSLLPQNWLIRLLEIWYVDMFLLATAVFLIHWLGYKSGHRQGREDTLYDLQRNSKNLPK